MWSLRRMSEKIAVNCGSDLAEKEISLNENARENAPTYKIYSLQDLYDLTSLKNGDNIDLAASLIYNVKKVTIVIDKKNEDIRNLLVEIAKSFEALRINVLIFDDKDISKLEKNDVIIKLNLSDNVDDKLFNKGLDLKVINIYLDKSSEHTGYDVNLYSLNLKNIDRLLSVEVLLKCVYLGVLAKI